MMRGRCLAILVVLATSLQVATACAQEDGASTAALFERANAAYEAGNYGAAIDDYTRVVAAGVAAPDLFYNLGNACFKQGDLGRAILWYERAHRLSPRDPDLRENLSLTRTLLRDKQLVVSEPRWRRALLGWHRETTARESAVVATVLYLLFCACAVCFVFRDTLWVARAYARVSIASAGRLLGLDKTQDLAMATIVVALVGGAFGASAFSKARAEESRAVGVVLAEEVSVFSGPSRDASVQFKVHEGTLVTVRDARPGWVRVDLPGDLSGWVDETSLDRI